MECRPRREELGVGREFVFLRRSSKHGFGDTVTAAASGAASPSSSSSSPHYYRRAERDSMASECPTLCVPCCTAAAAATNSWVLLDILALLSLVSAKGTNHSEQPLANAQLRERAALSLPPSEKPIVFPGFAHSSSRAPSGQFSWVVGCTYVHRPDGLTKEEEDRTPVNE